MAQGGTGATVSSMAILLSLVFGILGVGLLYLAIAISDASDIMKVVWASGLSLSVATVFLIVWTMALDTEKRQDLGSKQRSGR